MESPVVSILNAPLDTGLVILMQRKIVVVRLVQQEGAVTLMRRGDGVEFGCLLSIDAERESWSA